MGKKIENEFPVMKAEKKISQNIFTLMKAEISNNLKDKLLIELSNINSVHIKEKKKAKN